MEVKIVKIVRPANDVTRRTCIWRDPANGHSFIFSFITPIADVEIFSSKFGLHVLEAAAAATTKLPWNHHLRSFWSLQIPP